MITDNESEDRRELVIISGARRGIGKTFADHYRERGVEVIGIGRRGDSGVTVLDLLDETKVDDFVSSLDLERRPYLTFMHAVGIDKFEPNGKPHIDLDGDGIDDEVFATNVTAFMNMAEPLVDKLERLEIAATLIQIGSVGDIFEVPYWQSFTRSKNVVRRYLKSIPSTKIKGITLNVSSTLDEEGNVFARKNADTKYWQTSEEFLGKSIGVVAEMRDLNSRYMEADFYKHNPHFRPDYYTNLPRLFATWQRDMGYVGKEVPHGLRI